jgi:hypothetical protein
MKTSSKILVAAGVAALVIIAVVLAIVRFA